MRTFNPLTWFSTINVTLARDAEHAVNTHDATNSLSCTLMYGVAHCSRTFVHCSAVAQYSLTCTEYPT